MGNQKITKDLARDWKGDRVYTIKENGIKVGKITKDLARDWKGDQVYTTHYEDNVEAPDLSNRNADWNSNCGPSEPEPLGIGDTIFAMIICGGLFSIAGAFLGIFLVPNEISTTWTSYPGTTPIGYGFWIGGLVGMIFGLIFGISSNKKKKE